MKIHNLLALIKHDITEGILHRWKFFVISVLFFMFVDFVFIHNVSTAFADSTIRCSISDIILNMFVGNEPFNPLSQEGIHIAIEWLMFFALLFSSVGYYIIDDLRKNSVSFLLRTKSKPQWWISKIIWCVLLVIIYYALFFLCAVICAAFFGKISFIPNEVIAYEMFDIDVAGISVLRFIFSVLVLPLVISISVAVIESVISLILKPIYALLIVICYLALSAFYLSPCFLFNYSMLIRDNFDGVCGVANFYGALISVCVFAVGIFVGIVLIKRKDIL